MSNVDQDHCSSDMVALLKEYREDRESFRIFNDYDAATQECRNSSRCKIDALEEPLKSIASRLFSILDSGFFVCQVCEWKISYIAEALIHDVEVRNPLALANNTRALVEHLAALVAVVKELDILYRRLRGQGDEKTIQKAIERTEIFIHRAYYGKSPKVAARIHEQAIHVNDCLKVLKEEVRDIEEVYDFLCEYVHPNYGSNALASTGQLAGGRLNPPEEFHRPVLERLQRYCSLCMLFLKEHSVEHGAVFVRLHSLFELCLVTGARITNVFSMKAPNPEGDGTSKDTAFFFPSARTAFEAIEFCYRFLEKEGYEVQRRELGGFGEGVVYDVYRTNKGPVWFKVPASR